MKMVSLSNETSTVPMVVLSSTTKLDKGVQIGADVAGIAVGVAAGYMAERLLTAAIPKQESAIANVARYVAIYGLSGGIGALSGMGVTNGITDVYGVAKGTVMTIKSTVAAIKEEEVADGSN